MNHCKFGFCPTGAAPWPRPVATASHQSGSSTWELPCISNSANFHGLRLAEAGSFTFSWMCMRTASRKSWDSRGSRWSSLGWEPRAAAPQALAPGPALRSSSAWDAPVHSLGVIYSSCVGKQHLCKWVFLDNQEILESSGTPG